MFRKMILSIAVVLLLSGILVAQSAEFKSSDKEVTYTIPASSVVKVTLYEVTGKPIKTLVEEYKQAGQYKIDIAEENLSDGLYFIGIEAGEYREFKQLNLQD